MSITIDFYPCFVSEVLPQPAADAFVAFDRRSAPAGPHFFRWFRLAPFASRAASSPRCARTAIPPSELKLEDKRCAQEVEGFCSLRLRGQELRKRGFAGVATLIGLLIVGAVAYHSYGPRSRASTDVTSDRGSKRKAGNQPVSVITAQA